MTQPVNQPTQPEAKRHGCPRHHWRRVRPLRGTEYYQCIHCEVKDCELPASSCQPCSECGEVETHADAPRPIESLWGDNLPALCDTCKSNLSREGRGTHGWDASRNQILCPTVCKFPRKGNYTFAPRGAEMVSRENDPHGGCVCHKGSICTKGCEQGKHHDGCGFANRPPTTRTNEEIARDLAQRIADSGAFRYDITNQNAYREADLRMVANIVASALTTAADEAWGRAIAIVNNPYGDEVRCYGNDEPRAVSMKMVAALKAWKE